MKYRKVVAILLSMMLAASTVVGCGQASTETNSDAAVEEQTNQLVAAAESLFASHGAEQGKEETVYVLAGADGSTDKVIVSSWLKNPDEETTITDASNLTDIENVKGDETYTVDSEGNLVWNADGKDIYYQGTSNEQLPVDVSIEYQLDGKTVTPDELAGATGHLTITFRYQNNQKKDVTINGKQETIYQPFLMVSGMMLDNDKASNIEVTNGKAINDGDSTIVLGMALPGMNDSLNLKSIKDADGNAIDLDLPEEVVINADVEDFSLMTTITMADSHLFSSIDLDSDNPLDDLTDAIAKMEDASKQLVEGSSDLYDGTVTLSDGLGELVDGAGQVDDGVGTLKDATAALPDSAKQLYNGSLAIKQALKSENMSSQGKYGIYEAASAIGSGAGQISAGLKSGDASNPGIYEGISSIQSGAGQLAAGAKSGSAENPGIYEGAAAISTGADSLLNGVARLEAGAQALVSGSQALVAGVDRVMAGVDTAVAALTSEEEGANTIPNGVKALIAGMENLRTALGAGSEGLDSAVQALNALGLTQKDVAALTDFAASGELQKLAAQQSLTADQVALLIKAIQSAATSYNLQSGLTGMQTQLAGASDGIDELEAGANNITAGAKTIAAGLKNNEGESVYGGLAQIRAGLDNNDASNPGVLQGASQIAAGLQSNDASDPGVTEGLTSISAGAKSLMSGADQLAAGANTLSAGSGTLLSGTDQLVAGTSAVQTGAAGIMNGVDTMISGNNGSNLNALVVGLGQLSDSSVTLVDGISTLKIGTAELLAGAKTAKDGSDQLTDGAKQLKDGMAEFDKEAIQKLTGLISDETTGVYDRLVAMKDYAEEYHSFSGSANGEDTGVKFIYRTDAIEKED